MLLNNITPVKKPLTLQDLLELLSHSSIISHVAKGIYVESEILEVGSWLSAYAANKDEIFSKIITELENPYQFQLENDIQAPSFILYSNERITIRLVMWLPLQGELDRTPYSYEEAHDHNFDFWTVNFFGGGYRTRLYDYDYDKVTGVNNEFVELSCYGDKILSPNTVMFYFRSKDVHTQYPPDELSVSLNLIVRPIKSKHQYEFQIDSDALEGKIEARIKKGRYERYAFQNVLYNGLLSLENEKSRQLVHKVSLCNHREEIRLIAYEALLKHAQKKGNVSDIKSINEQAFKDQSLYIRNKISHSIGSMLCMSPKPR